MGQQTTVTHHCDEVGWQWFALKFFTVGIIQDDGAFKFHFQSIIPSNPPGIRAYQGGQAEVECVAVEQAGERLGDNKIAFHNRRRSSFAPVQAPM